jgi:serine/threonine-protein kinase
VTAPSGREPDDLPEPDDMADGLKAAFGDEPELQRASVLRRLRKQAGSRLDLHLHVNDEESDVPVKIDDDAKAMRDPSGRYQVLGEIGRGGVGVVYKGRDQDLGRDVAMKVLRPEHVSRPEIVERFVEEAQIGGQLQHPGIVPVYEIGLQSGERPYFAMKLVKGQTLAELLAQRKTPDEDRRRFLGIFEQVGQTIAYAHARRVVHRDLKPNNVMIGSFGEVQVVDWGFAKVLPKANAECPAPPKAPSVMSVISTVRSDPKKGSHSVVGSMMGTPAYMPPEQALGDVEHMDQRSDVFGLGAMLCEILTGQPPYLATDGDLIQQAARADLHGAYERLEQCGADAVVVALCRQCLSPARQARPDSAKQVAEAIAQYLTSVEERARQAQIRAAEAKVRARATLTLSAAAVLLLAVASGGYLHLQREKQSRRDQANQRVATALNDANVRLGEARVQERPDLALWARAADAAALAAQLAGETDVGAEERRLAGQLLATVRDEQSKAIAAAAQLDRDATMRQRLLEVRSERLDEQRGDYMVAEHRRRERGYTAAFESYLGGRDVTTIGKEEAVHALSGPIAVELASGLDSWSSTRRYLAVNDLKSPPDPAITSRLLDLSSSIDPDPWRVRMRAAMAAKVRDRAAIVALDKDADLDSLPAVSLLMLGSALAEVGDKEAAVAVDERACERFPSNFACVFDLALMHYHSGHFEQAQTWFRVAHALRPEMHETMNMLARSFRGQGDHRAEEQLFRQLAQLQPEEAEWPFQLGFSLQTQGRKDEAIACYQQAIELGPRDTIFYTNLAVVLGEEGRFDEALAVDRKALESDSQSARIYMNLGNTLADQGRLDDSLASLKRAVELAPNDWMCHYNLAFTLKDQHKFDEAAASYRRALELAPNDAQAHDALGLVLVQQRKFDEAVASCQRAVELDGKVAEYHFNLGHALASQNRLDDTIAEYRRAVELDPKDARFHLNLAIHLRNKGELDEALASYRRAASIWAGKHDAFAVEWYATAKREIEALRPRIAHRNRLLAVLRGESDSKDAAELGEAANLGHQRGEYALAVRANRLAIELEPKTARLHLNLGIALEQLGRLDDAIASYQRAVELDPKVARQRGRLADALLRRGQLDDAIAAYREFLELEPTSVAGWTLLCRALRQNGEMDDAIASARKAVELAPTQSSPMVELGLTLADDHRADEAVKCLEKAVELDPKSADAHHRLGAALVRNDRLNDALPRLRKAAELAPKEPHFQFDLADVLQKLGQRDAEVDCLRRVVELDPDNAVASYRLGWYAQEKEHWDEAVAFYRRAIDADPNHAAALCNLASCLLKTGRFAESVDCIRRGHELGSKRADWKNPSAEWLATAEKMESLAQKLPDLLAHRIEPADVEERLAFVEICQAKGLHHAAVGLYRDAFAAHPEWADDGGPHRYNAACSAARAGAGRCEDSAQLDTTERARLRKQALDWLRAELDLLAKKIATGSPDDRTAVQAALRHWQEDDDLVRIRDAAPLATLPKEERDAFGRLWADVSELLGRR